jgi:hypothetical protein
MKSGLLSVTALLAISQSTLAMKPENQGAPRYSFDPLSTTLIIAGMTAGSIYSAYNSEPTNTNEILLVVDDEPVNIRSVMKALYRSLALYYAKTPSTPTSEIAWMTTMRAVICATFLSAVNAAEEVTTGGGATRAAAWDFPLAAAHTACWDAYAVGPIDLKAASDAIPQEVLDAAKLAAQRAADEFVYRDTPFKYSEAGQAVYRAAERVFLNWLRDNIAIVVDAVFQNTLNALEERGDNVATTPFSIVPFVNEHFGNLKPEAMLFLAPWLVLIVPVNEIPPNHQSLFIDILDVAPQAEQFLLVKLDTGTVVHQLPHELVSSILSTLIGLVFPPAK